MRSLALALMLVPAPLLLACGKSAVEARASVNDPIEVVVRDPSLEPAPEPPRPAPVAVSDVSLEATGAVASDVGSEEKVDLPRSWSGVIIPGLSFADALRKARAARDAHARLAFPIGASATQEAGVKAWFTRALSLADQASRMYAAAFHAPDASREGRIDAIAEAAELGMSMARAVDDAGLGLLPATWRSDPAVATTFEDIAVGPARRWRDEAKVLARQCVDSARANAITTDAARRCVALRTGSPLKLPKRAAGTDVGAPCACAAGDPLCSASLSGWCPR